ncbi:MAG TPA: hypothetical protein VD788_18015 [Candidatus Polarisedimenticolaceae bacterium]|nr:hypothetical protein [Candidatus Polarisedimenticolaceae bacterium]
MKRAMLSIGICTLAVGCGGSDSPSQTLSGPITLATVQQQVFSPSCAVTDCHIGPDPEQGLDLSAGSAYANLVNVQAAEINNYMRVEPGNAADSYVYMKITNDLRILGDPMPLVGGPLSDSKIRLVERWIDEGANP